MKAYSTSVWNIKRIALLVFLYLLVLLYISFFYEFLEYGEWLYVKDFARIVVPDTYIYQTIGDQSYFHEVINAAIIKNSIFPAIIWFLFDGNWLTVGLFNIVILFLISVYMERIARFFCVKRSRVKIGIVVFLIMPSSIIYSVGALKELPSALLMLVFLHGLIAKKYKEIFVAATLLVLARYQFIVLITFIILISLFVRKYKFRTTLFVILVFAALYPVISYFPWLNLSTAENYRELYGQGGLGFGNYTEYLRNNIPVMSALGVSVRVVQSMFEPILSFFSQGFTLYEYDHLSLYAFSQFFSLLFLMPFLLRFFVKMYRVFVAGAQMGPSVQVVFGSALVYIFLVGGFSFVHHRYLYPLFPIIILASMLPVVVREPSSKPVPPF